MKSVRTVDNQVVLSGSRVQRLGRDAKLLLRIAKMALQYWIAGWVVRRAYRAREARGEVYWVDEHGREGEIYHR